MTSRRRVWTPPPGLWLQRAGFGASWGASDVSTDLEALIQFPPGMVLLDAFQNLELPSSTFSPRKVVGLVE
eukprot:3135242-Alexandrium_andersonii.AAC.1